MPTFILHGFKIENLILNWKKTNPVINYINKATINFKNYAKTSNPAQNLSNSLTRPQADVDDNDMGKYNI